MAENEEALSVEERVDRSVRRLLVKIGIVLMLVAVGVGWASIGFPGAAYLGVYQFTPMIRSSSGL